MLENRTARSAHPARSSERQAFAARPPVPESFASPSRARRRRSVSPGAASCEGLEQRALFSGAGPLVINEFMADNSTGRVDENGDHSDWIEIRNPTAAPVNADGYFLTDDASVPNKWRLPAVTIPAGGYQVVNASGKDRTTPQLHTNFKLANEGEYLALVRPDGITVADEYAPEYPQQVENVSFGVLNGELRYFATPTPGAANSAAGSVDVVSDTVFSVDRGFFDAPFEVRIATLTPGATIRYTTNGAKPTATAGTVYAGPITIAKTTVLRAAAFKAGSIPSNVDTQTYIFVDDVVQQTVEATIAAGFPSTWGGTVPDYGMDPDVIGQNGEDLFNGEYAATIRADLKSIPTMSVVLPTADMFGSNGIYTNSTARGDSWERATSVELIDPGGDGSHEFQVNAGIQVQGGAFRSDGLTKKHSFRLLFKDKWGVSKLEYPLFGPDSADEFDSVTLRADANDGWQWSSAGGQALYARDTWSRYTQREMGQPSSDSGRVHLYINGIYWGLYTPTERPDAAFGATYVGGDKSQWDVLNQDGVTDGTATAWNTMLSLADAVRNAPDEAARSAAYQRIQGNNPDGTDNPAYQDYLDVDNLIDYMLVNIFTGNVDWPHRNWYAGRLKADDGIGTDATGFKFFSWDAESALGLWADVNSNRVGVNQGPAQPYDRLRSSPEFRARFAERVQLHMFNGGALSTEANKARMKEITDQVDRAIVAESARWGDQHTDPPYTRADWANERDNLLRAGGYFDQRWSIVLDQLRAAGLYGAGNAPQFTPPGGPAAPGTVVTISSPGGTLYYTVNGSDPRNPDGTPNPGATAVATPGGTVLPYGSTWKYLDDGSDQGTDWFDPTFDDAAWKAGRGQLGYGDGDETTIVGYGPNAADKYPTTYFRKSFAVADPASLPPLKLQLQRDDGAMVYLNGEEVARTNMPGGAADYRTYASSVVEDGTVEFDLDPSMLRAGANVFAVEMHQANGGSSDISFDLQLLAPAPSVPVTLPGGQTTLRARSRDAAGNWSPLTEAVYNAGGVVQTLDDLVITEVNYHPHAPEAALGETAVSTQSDDYEFVELMNTGAARLRLAGVRFWLGINFRFPDDSYLDPGERAVVVKNVAAFRARYGTGPRVLGTFGGNFGNNGQLTILKDGHGNLLKSFHYGDSGDWPNRADGGGATLEAIDPAGDLNDPDNWRSSREYGGSPGAAGSGPVAGVIVNEVLSDTDPPVEDAIELYNPTAQAVDLGGWYLSDSATNYRKYRIPAGTTIPAGGYRVFGEQTLGFSLDSDGDDVWLMQSDPATGRLTRFVDRVEFGAAANGEPFGRWPNGAAGAGLFPMASATPGAANSGPRVGPVVINEIMYAPISDGQEFIELRNLTGSDVSLAGWQFTAGIDYTFPAGAVIPASGYLLLVGGDPDAFRAANAVPAEVPVFGPYTIGGFLNVLDNAGERLVLSRPGTAGPGGRVLMYEVDRVRYDAAAPWPDITDAAGSSIARRNSAVWGDTPLNWGAETDGGSPGRANFGGDVFATVVGRHVFYNRSAFDNNRPDAEAADDGAVATDKEALLPGAGVATFANVTSYSRGLNGIMIDIAGRGAGAAIPLPGDFAFKVGDGDVAGWLVSVAVPTITVRPGAGVNGTDRITLTFADGAIKNTWLQVMVLPGPRTGLAAPDVFYFGNLVGETGDGTTNSRVNALDLGAVKRALNGNSSITGRFDFNRDGHINALDLGAVKSNLNRLMSFITPPPPIAAQRVAVTNVWDGEAPDLLGR